MSLNVPALLHRADGYLDEAVTLFLAGNLRSVEPSPSVGLGPLGESRCVREGDQARLPGGVT